MGTLVLLFVLLPALELTLLIEVGSRIGTIDTLGLIVLTGIVGASLARYQGLQVLHQVQTEMSAGRLPGQALIDGMIILVAGALLVTPGLLTDAVGFLCLIPGTRQLLKAALWRWLERRLRTGHAHMSVHFDTRGGPPPGGPIYDVTPEDEPRYRDRLPRDD